MKVQTHTPGTVPKVSSFTPTGTVVQRTTDNSVNTGQPVTGTLTTSVK